MPKGKTMPKAVRRPIQEDRKMTTNVRTWMTVGYVLGRVIVR